MIYGIKHAVNGHACTRITHGNYEISIAMDDSWGSLSQLSRSDIRVYAVVDKVSTDVTDKVFGTAEHDTVFGSFDNLMCAMEYVRRMIECDKQRLWHGEPNQGVHDVAEVQS
jgi:hypothetical protein